MPLLLVANKLDLHEKRQISTEKAMEVAQKYKAEYFEVSAKTGYNIDKVFNALIRALRLKKQRIEDPEKREPSKSWWREWCSLI